MKTLLITLDETTAAFYRQLAEHLSLPTERVLADALFKLAGELSLEALEKKRKSAVDFTV